MTLRTVEAINWILNPYATAVPFLKEKGKQWQIDDEAWVNYHTSTAVKNAVVISTP